MIENYKIQANSFATYVKYVVSGVLGFTTAPLLIKYLTPEDYGVFQIVFSMNTLVIYLSSFGLSSIFLRYIPEFIEAKFSDGIIKLTLGGIIIRIFGVTSILLIAYIFNEFIFNYFSFTFFLKQYYLLILVFVFFIQLDDTLGAMVLTAYFEQVKLSVIQILQAFIRLSIILYCIFYDLGLTGLFIGLLANEILVSILFLFTVMQITSSTIKSITDKQLLQFPLKRISKFGGYSYLSSSTGIFRDIMTDNFIISHFLTITDVGIYGFTYTILNLLAGINPIMVLKSQISYLIIKKYTKSKTNSIFLQIHRLTSTISISYLIPLMVFLIIFKNDLINLINKTYQTSDILFLVLPIMIIANGLQFSYGFIISATETMQYRFYSNIFSIYNLVAGIILVQYYSLFGVAIATTSTAIFTTIYLHFITTRKLKILVSYYWMGILKIIIYVTLSLCLSLATEWLGNPTFFISAIIFIFIYTFLLLINPPLHPKDYSILQSIHH